MISHDLGLEQLETITADITDRTRSAELTAPVPSCPGWHVAVLVGHIGEAHRWAEHAVRVGNRHAPESAPARTDRSTLGAWYAESAALLVATLRTVGADHPCWAFGPPPHRAGFWSRRQAHEAAVHRWDLAAASGEDAGYPAPLAVDAVDEVAAMFFPRQVRLGRIPPLTASLRVSTGDQEWLLAGDGTSSPVGPPNATVCGPADALALLLWGRIGLGDPRVGVTGDRSAAAAVLAAGIVP
jgi:uncharacterized protein (TIGR03083 family)